MATRLVAITDRLEDATIRSPNGTCYCVQIYNTMTRAGYQAVIQKIGAPDNRPLMKFYPSRALAREAINAVLKKIGVQID